MREIFFFLEYPHLTCFLGKDRTENKQERESVEDYEMAEQMQKLDNVFKE